MAQLYDYQDYRNWLKAHLSDLKKRSSAYSQRAIIAKMGVTSTGFLANILAGRTNLTPAYARKLAKVLKLTKSETEYFETMVLFNQAKTIDDKTEYADRLLKLKQTKLKVLTEKQLTLFSKWHYPIIREMATVMDISDPARVAKHITPPITPQEAEESIQALVGLGFLQKGKDGTLRPSDPIVTSGDEVRSFDIVKFQARTLQHAREALVTCPQEERDISVLTMTASEESFKIIKSELQKVRKKILSIIEQDQQCDQVYQLSMNLFPATKREGE